ncbi:MAG: hypothetical protein VX112_04950 [Pseudomonadota bacterium]|nr:hypothetical protein [Pseudomonadota bacterium]
MANKNENEPTFADVQNMLLNGSLKTIQPLKDKMIDVPRDGKCGWWALALNLNMLICTGYLDNIAQTDYSGNFQKLLSSFNDIVSNYEGTKHYKKIENLNELKRFLVSQNTPKRILGTEVMQHQHVMMGAIILYCKRLGQNPEDSSTAEQYDQAEIISPNQDNYIKDAMSIAFELDSIPRPQWLKVETGFYFAESLGIEFINIEHHVDPASLYHEAVADAFSNSYKKDTELKKDAIDVLKRLRGDHLSALQGNDGRVCIKNKPYLKLVLEASHSRVTGGGTYGEHFWSLIPKELYQAADKSSLALPQALNFFDINIGNIQDKLTEKDKPSETKKNKVSWLKTSYNHITNPYVILLCGLAAILYANNAPLFTVGIIAGIIILSLLTQIMENSFIDEIEQPEMIKKPYNPVPSAKLSECRPTNKNLTEKRSFPSNEATVIHSDDVSLSSEEETARPSSI